MEINQIAQTFAEPLTGTPAVTKDGFAQAIDQQNSKIQALQLEQRRTAAFFGPQSPNAQRVQSLVTMHQTLLARTQSASSAAQARVPQPDPQKYILYGTVSMQDGLPAADIDVSALDANDTTLQTSTTDACGAYSIALDSSTNYPPTGDSDSNTGQRMEEGNREGAADTAPRVLVVHLVVTDKNKSFQITSQLTHEFALGQLDREDFTVPASRPTDQC